MKTATADFYIPCAKSVAKVPVQPASFATGERQNAAEFLLAVNKVVRPPVNR